MLRTEFTRRITTTSPANLITESKIRLTDGSSFFLHKQPLSPATLETRSEADLPPLVHKCVGTQRIYLSQSEKEQMQQLRNEDPKKWSVFSLAQKFNCTHETVNVYSKLPTSAIAGKQKEFNAKFDAMKWTEKVRIVNRIRRKAQW
jgi:hypothetical protein